MKTVDDRVLDNYGLTSEQKAAVLSRDPVVLVTAGAGCGKTRTLVGRYLWAVQQGVMPRRMAAITFTEKAAREMRNRVRSSIRDILDMVPGSEEQQLWMDAAAQMDSAHIGTIHSLCAELLRSHPVEAAVDPEFTVLDEGLAAAVRAAAVRETIAWAAGENTVVPLFELLSPGRTVEVLGGLLERRLDMLDVAQAEESGGMEDVIGSVLAEFMECEPVYEAVSALRELQTEGALLEDAGDKLCEQVEYLLDDWAELQVALEDGRAIDAAAVLFRARRSHMALNKGKRGSISRQMLEHLREAYEACVQPWLGGGSSRDPLPDAVLEARIPGDTERLRILFDHALGLYMDELQRQRALDFDALEAGALSLMKDTDVLARWQDRFDLVLVDEFQDTNARQRDLLEALAGGGSTSLFLVGDARQSIYRFRGADVAVFRQLESDVYGSSGSSLTLEATFRAHEHLLRSLDVLVGNPMNNCTDPAPLDSAALYRVPYTALRSMRAPHEGESPAVSIVLGRGSSALEARPAAASALALTLLEMKEEGSIGSWDDAALLFRASTGFGAYEEALEARRIPYITVAGRGFYDRPEIRDVLNMLAALASPWDDAAMAGLLRSPAVGMSDVGLYQIRRTSNAGTPLYQALEDATFSRLEDEQARLRAAGLLNTFLPLVDRERVAVLIKSLVDYLDYRPMLASSGERLWRNLDKLVEDARASEMVRVRAFLEYVRTLRDIGVREGEAPAQAEGAVRLMTIHKAKGLEFPVVVLADASRRPGGRGSQFYIHPETGLVFNPQDSESSPLLYRYAKWQDRLQEEAEEMRLLYVSATRAKEHLVISGYLSQKRTKWSADGWTGLFLEQAGLDPGDLAENPGRQNIRLENGEKVLVWSAPDDIPARALPEAVEPAREMPDLQLMKPLYIEEEDTADEDEPEHDWRVTGESYPPAAAVGSMVHAALRSWLFPGDDGLEVVLEAAAYEMQLLETDQRQRAVQEARELLGRLGRHPLRKEVDQADSRMFEVPYSISRPAGSGADSGRIDLLYRRGDTWYVVDYKTDELADAEEISEAVVEYRPQVERYRAAVRGLLQADPVVMLCFLDVQGAVQVEKIGPGQPRQGEGSPR